MEGVSQDINDKKQKMKDLEEKEAEGAAETKVMGQDILEVYITEKWPVCHDNQRDSEGRGNQRDRQELGHKEP